MKLSSRAQTSQTDWVSAHYQTPLALGGWRKSKRDIFAATFSFLIKNIFPPDRQVEGAGVAVYIPTSSSIQLSCATNKGKLQQPLKKKTLGKIITKTQRLIQSDSSPRATESKAPLRRHQRYFTSSLTQKKSLTGSR